MTPFDQTKPYKNIDGVNINLTQAEIDANVISAAINQAEASVAQLKSQATQTLQKTDITVLRCYSAGVSVPADIQAYRVALRAIANGTDTTSTVLPTAPTDFPANT